MKFANFGSIYLHVEKLCLAIYMLNKLDLTLLYYIPQQKFFQFVLCDFPIYK